MIPGIDLILVGLFILLIQLFHLAGWIAIVGLGIAFLLGYHIWVRNLGLLIPAMVLIAIGAFAGFLESGIIPQNFEAAFLLFLGVAFLFVYALHTRFEESWGGRNWPLFPGLILSVLGALFLMVQNEVLMGREQWEVVLQWWPIIFVISGVWVLLRQRTQQ